MGGLRGSLVILLLAAPVSGAAELYRCTDAHGNVSYTGDPHNCRGRATEHQTRREIQSSGTPSPRPAAARTRSRRPLTSRGSSEEAAAAMWKQKRSNAEAELRQIETRLPRWERLQTHCNRGADAWYTDESGIKHTVTCTQIAEALERAEAQRTRLRAYLGGGLEEECRRAGCLPGWIR